MTLAHASIGTTPIITTITRNNNNNNNNNKTGQGKERKGKERKGKERKDRGTRLTRSNTLANEAKYLRRSDTIRIVTSMVRISEMTISSAKNAFDAERPSINTCHPTGHSSKKRLLVVGLTGYRAGYGFPNKQDVALVVVVVGPEHVVINQSTDAHKKT